MSWAVARRMLPTELRNLGKMVGPNDGTRTLIESIVSREVIAALDDWRQTGLGGVLVGALALSFHAKPRFENQIELLVPDCFGQPELTGFVGLGQRTLIHRQTSTKLRLLAPSQLALSAATFERILATTVTSDGVEIASRAGLVAILLGDRRTQASADIVALLRLGAVDLPGWELSSEQIDRLARLQVEADDENRRACEWETRTGEPW